MDESIFCIKDEFEKKYDVFIMAGDQKRRDTTLPKTLARNLNLLWFILIMIFLGQICRKMNYRGMSITIKSVSPRSRYATLLIKAG